ncbi:MAG: hypothetical protein LQ346_006023 [Caloplaca aetnensis]|nr:MAG: hypothetical protein LQ346_006023 [Caloplaca aetnensis]
MGQKTPAPAVSGLLDSSLTNGLETRSSDDGRACDFSDGYYVSWADTSNAIRYWCSVHSDVIVLNGKSVDDLTVTGYKSGKWKVQLHVKYQNDQRPRWRIDEEACNWYLSYIAQGCTKGGNKPSNGAKQVTDGGTFYEPKMGSVDFKWKYSKV